MRASLGHVVKRKLEENLINEYIGICNSYLYLKFCTILKPHFYSISSNKYNFHHKIGNIIIHLLYRVSNIVYFKGVIMDQETMDEE